MQSDLQSKLAETLKQNGYDTISGTAQQIGVAMSTLHTYVQNERIKSTDVGRYKYISVEDARALIPEINKNRKKVVNLRAGLDKKRGEAPELYAGSGAHSQITGLPEIHEHDGTLQVQEVLEKLKPEITAMVISAIGAVINSADFENLVTRLAAQAIREVLNG